MFCHEAGPSFRVDSADIIIPLSYFSVATDVVISLALIFCVALCEKWLHGIFSSERDLEEADCLLIGVQFHSVSDCLWRCFQFYLLEELKFADMLALRVRR